LLVGSGCSPVLVDHSVEDSMVTDRGVEQGHRGGVVPWWALVEALVRTVVIEMAHVLVEDGAGVLLVVDQ
jgi:diadenosine tetraphosphatase ApaH/serine/threonine PP2A family protein phosphatase